jgi:hypothetical protein
LIVTVRYPVAFTLEMYIESEQQEYSENGEFEEGVRRASPPTPVSSTDPAERPFTRGTAQYMVKVIWRSMGATGMEDLGTGRLRDVHNHPVSSSPSLFVSLVMVVTGIVSAGHLTIESICLAFGTLHLQHRVSDAEML